ncbi:N-acylethanolamine-hydrolyzing acid amidase-like [Lineus longissimus]|uniref:N-acylethanolamine-hydrolyzing acid amidase-like n=1 Tax=Lineus longissimus TaxID=88925 RepID=UPI002B4E5AE5
MATNILLFCFAIFSAFLVIYCQNHERTLAPKFSVNLDLPPEDRWTHVVEVYKSHIPIIRKSLAKYIPPELMPLVDFIADQFHLFLPDVFTREIKGIAKAAGMPAGDVFLLNCLYEITSFCTSIVAQDSHGHIIHGRNLDYGNDPEETEIFKNATIEIDYQRNGKTIYSATTILGYTGVVNGQRPGAFTVSFDEREKHAGAAGAVENFFMAFLDGGVPDLMLMREVLENATSYKEAVQQITTRKLIADGYYIVGGVQPGEGAVITRDRTRAADVWNLDADNSRWFLVETNYDHWLPTPQHDDRRFQANKVMKGIGQAKINNDTMMEALSTLDVLNGNTVVTSIMSAADPSMYRSWVRYDSTGLKKSGYRHDTALKFQPLSHKVKDWKRLYSPERFSRKKGRK